MPTTLDVFISSKMDELKAERQALYKLLPTLNFGDIQLRAWMFENDAPATEKSIRDVYLKGLKNSALYIGLFWNQYSKDDQTPNWTIDEFDRATEWGIERHIYVKDVDAKNRDPRLTEFLNQHNDVQFGITANWYKTDVEFSEKVRQSIAAWIQARQRHSTSPEALLIRNPNDLRRPKKMFGREALLTQIDSLVDGGEKGLLQGAGGMGKTAVAGEAAARFMARTGKPVLWLTIGSGEADIVFEALAQPAKMTKEVASASGEAKAHALRTAVRATGAGLVILDNAWNGAALDTTLNALPNELPVLVTSRQKYPMENVLEVGKLPAADALGLLTYHSKREADPDAPELCKKLGNLAFALEVAGKTMKMKGWASAEMMNEIQEAPHRLERPVIYGEQEVISVQDLLTASLHALPDGNARRTFMAFGALFAPRSTSEMMTYFFNSKSEISNKLTVDFRAKYPQYQQMSDDDVKKHLQKALSQKNNSGLIESQLQVLEQYGLAELISTTSNAIEHYQIHDLAYSYARTRNSKEQLQRALDACLAYTAYYNEPSLPHFAALRPVLDNLLNAAEWAFGVGRYEAVEAFAWGLYSAKDGGFGFLYYQGYAPQSINLLGRAADAAGRTGNKQAQGANLGNLGIAYSHLGQVDKAISYYEQSLTISREIGDKDTEGNQLGNLGSAYRNLGQVDKAISYYEQALTITREIGDRGGEGSWLGNLGTAYSVLGQVDKAISYYEQALTITREIGDKHAEGSLLGNLGNEYRNLGQVDKAISYCEQALTISREIGDKHAEGSLLGNLGLAYGDLGLVDKAITNFGQALTISREIADRRNEGKWLGNLGTSYHALGLVDKAITNFGQALTISREIGDKYGEGSQLGNLAVTYRALGQVDKAITYYEQALTISREIADRRNEGVWLGNLGNAYRALGQADKAITYYEQALTISSEIGDRMREAAQMHNIGALRVDQGDYPVAVDYFQRARAIYADIGAQHLIKTVDENIAIVRRMMGGR